MCLDGGCDELDACRESTATIAKLKAEKANQIELISRLRTEKAAVNDQLLHARANWTNAELVKVPRLFFLSYLLTLYRRHRASELHFYSASGKRPEIQSSVRPPVVLIPDYNFA